MRFIISIIIILSCSKTFAQNWLGCGQGFYYPPKALFADTISNKLYASGFELMCDGMLANSIASWDGTKWDTLNHGAIGGGDKFLIRYKNKLYLQKGYNIYTWDFNTQIWDSVPGGKISGDIWDAEIDNNNNLIMVGQFNKMGSVPAHNIVSFDGSTFSPVGFPAFSYYLRTVAIYQNEIYIGGNFNDTLHGGIAKWNGTQWIDLNEGLKGGGPPEVLDLKVYNNRLYAGGAYYGTKNGYNPSLAVWNGIKWNNIGGVYYSTFPWGVVYKLHLWNNKLLVCGNFDRAGDINVNNLALWNDTNWCSVNTDPEGLVWVSAIFQNKLYVAEHETLNGDTVHLLGYLTGNYTGTCGTTIGVNELSNNISFSFFPNPTTSILNITAELNQLQNATITITNYLGQVVFTSLFTNQIDLQHLSAGMYFLTVQDKNSKKTVKIVKQ